MPLSSGFCIVPLWHHLYTGKTLHCGGRKKNLLTRMLDEMVFVEEKCC